jgi:hypothetical protein
MNIKDINDYVRLLDTHDWFFEYSDDHSVWTKGKKAQTILTNKFKQSPVYEELYSAFAACAITSAPKAQAYAELHETVKQIRENFKETA